MTVSMTLSYVPIMNQLFTQYVWGVKGYQSFLSPMQRRCTLFLKQLITASMKTAFIVKFQLGKFKKKKI